MDYLQNLIEYYDELYPVTESIKKFYSEKAKSFPGASKVLSYGCNTGSLEFFLAKQGCDVTGIETIPAFLQTVNKIWRTQLLSLRFFEISNDDMRKFLGKGFYNIISCLENRLCTLASLEEIQKVLETFKMLSSKKGIVILQIYNYELLNEYSQVDFPQRESLRASTQASIKIEEEKVFYNQTLINSLNKELPVYADKELIPLTRKDLKKLAKKTGFKSCKFYSDFDLTPFKSDSPDTICILS